VRWIFSATNLVIDMPADHKRPFCRTLFPTAFSYLPKCDAHVLFAVFCEKSAARKLTWSMSPGLRFGASWAPYSSSFARGRARRMDGIGLFHFRTECLPIIRFCEPQRSLTIRRVNILLIVMWKLTRDIAYALAKIKVTYLFNIFFLTTLFYTS